MLGRTGTDFELDQLRNDSNYECKAFPKRFSKEIFVFGLFGNGYLIGLRLEVSTPGWWELRRLFPPSLQREITLEGEERPIASRTITSIENYEKMLPSTEQLSTLRYSHLTHALMSTTKSFIYELWQWAAQSAVSQPLTKRLTRGLSRNTGRWLPNRWQSDSGDCGLRLAPWENRSRIPEFWQITKKQTNVFSLFRQSVQQAGSQAARIDIQLEILWWVIANQSNRSNDIHANA